MAKGTNGKKWRSQRPLSIVIGLNGRGYESWKVLTIRNVVKVQWADGNYALPILRKGLSAGTLLSNNAGFSSK